MTDRDLPRRKARLRRQALLNRARLGADVLRAAADRIAGHVTDLPAWAAARTVHTYVSLPAELDTHGLVAEARRRDCRVLVPYVAGPGQPMRHAEITGLEELAPGHWGLLQPTAPRFVEDLQAIDVVLVPGLLFDRTGARLGYGGGYYDRFLAGLQGVLKVGLAHDESLVDAVPTEPHDVTVDLIVTPSGVHEPQARGHARKRP